MGWGGRLVGACALGIQNYIGIDNNKKYDFVIIQWSTIDRWDYPISFTSENDTPLIKLNT